MGKDDLSANYTNHANQLPQKQPDGQTTESLGRGGTRPYLALVVMDRFFENRAFAYVRLKSLMFAYFEKKYFFPALWPSEAWNQYGEGKTTETQRHGEGRRPLSLGSYGGRASGAWNQFRKWSAGGLEYWGRRLQGS